MAVVGIHNDCVWIKFNNGYRISFFNKDFSNIRLYNYEEQVKVNITHNAEDVTAAFFGTATPTKFGAYDYEPIGTKLISAEEIPLLLNEIAKIPVFKEEDEHGQEKNL